MSDWLDEIVEEEFPEEEKDDEEDTTLVTLVHQLSNNRILEDPTI